MSLKSFKQKWIDWILRQHALNFQTVYPKHYNVFICHYFSPPSSDSSILNGNVWMLFDPINPITWRALVFGRGGRRMILSIMSWAMCRSFRRICFLFIVSPLLHRGGHRAMPSPHHCTILHLRWVCREYWCVRLGRFSMLRNFWVRLGSKTSSRSSLRW